MEDIYLGEVKAMAIPYKSFKERLKITKQHEKEYKIEMLKNILYLTRREE